MTSSLPELGTLPGFCQPISSLSHLVAAAVAAVGSISLIRLGRRNAGRTWALAIYAFCVIAVLAVSGTYHSLDRDCAVRATMKRLDYYAIWLLIAGTFTAVHGVMHRGFWRGGILCFVWAYALLGIGAQILWFRFFSGTPGLVLYLGLGWVGILSVVKLGREIGYRAVLPLWFAGVPYSVGAVMEAMRLPVVVEHWFGPHEFFHFAVLLGIALHWTFIRRLALEYAPATNEGTANVLTPGRVNA